MNLLKQVTLDRVNRRKDKTFTFTFSTDLEQNKEDINNIFDCVDNGGTLFFKPNGLLTEDEINAIEKAKVPNEGKSKSQRFRSVLYVYWQQKATNKDFNTFYSDKMEEFIQHYKDLLENEV